ncbi:MAG TPA: hypothetical protein VGG51_10865 [Candidatus Cybelea sp.]|jgi:hypothetical protein
MLRRLVCSLIASALLLPVAAAAQVKELNFPVRPNAIAVRLESDKPVYRVGEPIELRLILINRTSQAIIYANAPPPYAVSKLTVVNAAGNTVPTTAPHGPQYGFESSMDPTELEPGKPFVMEYSDAETNGATGDWVDIKHWNYDIGPGTYRITASIEIGAFGKNAAQFTAAARSNEVKITVLK